MPHHRVRYASHQGPPYTAPAPAAHHYQPGTYVLSQGYDLRSDSSLPQVRLRYCSSGRARLLYLRVEYLPGSLLGGTLEVLLEHWGLLLHRPLGGGGLRVDGVPGGDAEDVDQVHLGGSLLGQVGRGSGGQLCLLGAVGGDEDLGGEDAHAMCVLLSGCRTCGYMMPALRASVHRRPRGYICTWASAGIYR